MQSSHENLVSWHCHVSCLKMVGGTEVANVDVSAVSAISTSVLPYIYVGIKASFLELQIYIKYGKDMSNYYVFFLN